MIARLFPSTAWRPSPAYARFMREAQKRSARARLSARLAAARAVAARHATLIALCVLLVVYGIAVPVVAFSERNRTLAEDRATVERVARDIEAYRALALGLVRSPQDGRLQVRLTAAGREEMLALLEQMRVILEEQRGEVRP